MRKLSCFVGAALVVFSMAACLNPVGFDPDFKLGIEGNITIDGPIETRDITAASTYIVNMSKSLDFTDVTITQTLNPKLATETPPHLVSQFDNTFDTKGFYKIIKAKYVQASDVEYEVGLTVQNGPSKALKTPSIQKWTDVYATQSKGIYYVWMYRTDKQEWIDDQIAAGVPPELADVVVVSPNDPNFPRPFPPPKPGDTNTTINIDVGANDSSAIVDALNKIANQLVNLAGGNVNEKDAEDENGSVPPVISPKNRLQMGTFVVVNLSRTRNVDWVEFVDGGRTFTKNGIKQNITHTITPVELVINGSRESFPAVGTQDRRGIALLQGEYRIKAGHNTSEVTEGWKTGLILPSNDPQTIREHYIYFYKDKNGKYVLNVTEPKESDMDPTDILPPSLGFGVGRITLMNKTSKAYLEMVTLEAQDHRDRGAKSYTYNYVNPTNADDGFVRKVPVGPSQSNDVNVIGTPQFPIDGWFIVSVKALTAEGDATVTRLVYLNNTLAEIIVTDNDVAIAKVPGARITVINNSDTSSVVNSVRIEDSRAPTNYQTYGVYASNTQTTTFDVLNTPGMPIIEGEVYQAKVNITVTKQFKGKYTVNGVEQEDPIIQISGTIPKAIPPDGTLYGKDGPASNLKTITITEQDLIDNNLLPASPPPAPAFIPVTDVVILNGTYDTDGGVKFFAKDGQNRQIQWAVNPDDATARPFPNNAPNGYWKVGVLDGTANAAHYTVTREGVVKVNASWSYEYLNVAFVMENGQSNATRHPGTYPVSNLLLDGIDPAVDYVKVIKLKTPPPVVTPPPKPPEKRANLILHVGGSSTGKLGSNESFNLIEVYQRPPIVAAFTNPPVVDMSKAPTAANGYARAGYITSPGTQTTYTSHQGDDAGALNRGSVTTGRTGWYWEEYPCDEFNDRFGSTAEGWLQGFIHGTGYADRGDLTKSPLNANLWNYPNSTGKSTSAFGTSMGFRYWGNGTTAPDTTHAKHFSGRAEPYFLGSVWLGGSDDPHSADRAAVDARSAAAGVSGEWVTPTSNNRLNAPGDEYKLVVPTDQGKLWIRMRADEIWDHVGYRWKASTIYEWFVYDPATNYVKDANGNVIIDVTPFNEPYMRYRK